MNLAVAGFLVVGFDDLDGNFVELFPNVETVELPPDAFCTAQELERVMAERAEWVENLVSTDEHGGRYYPVAPEA